MNPQPQILSPSSDGDVSTESLLECLRQNLIASNVVNPTSKEEERAKMNLVLDHILEFPTKIRTVVSEISSEEPSAFLVEVRKAARALFFGLPYQAGMENDQANELHPTEEIQPSQDEQPILPFHWWHGLNSDIDTDDQVEIVFRLFPNILCEKQKASPLSSLNNTYPIYALLFCSKSLSFIPLFAELGTELGLFPKQERAGLFCFMKNVVFHLIYNNLLKDKKEERNYEELDATYTQIFQRLKKTGLVIKSDIYDLDLVPIMVYRSMLNPVIQSDQRLRFLIHWDPSLLITCGRNKNLLNVHLEKLHSFVVRGYPSPSRKVRPRDFQRFHLLVQLGMTHFHESLGFVFHNNTLIIACEIFGNQKVTKVINDELRKIWMKSTSSNDLLRTMVFGACTNEEISLDGLYTLLRHDPIALFPTSPST